MDCADLVDHPFSFCFSGDVRAFDSLPDIWISSCAEGTVHKIAALGRPSSSIHIYPIS